MRFDRFHATLTAAMATERPTAEHSMRAALDEAERSVNDVLVRLGRWWIKQTPRVQMGTAAAALLGVVLVVNTCLGAAGRVTTSGTESTDAAATPARAVAGMPTVEIAPSDAGKAWTVNRRWQGNGPFMSEQFTVGDHWRVDWLWSPNQPGAALQVFIFDASGFTQLQIAANTHLGGADTSFWMGPGTYHLKVNAIGGDWKLDVQDLR
jgi:hypothetical protein